MIIIVIKNSRVASHSWAKRRLGIWLKRANDTPKARRVAGSTRSQSPQAVTEYESRGAAGECGVRRADSETGGLATWPHVWVCVWQHTWASWLGPGLSSLPRSGPWLPGFRAGNIIKAIRFSKYDNLCNKLEIYAMPRHILCRASSSFRSSLVALIEILFYCWTVLIHT